MPSRKQLWERSILELVYDPDEFHVLASDSPDFHLSREGGPPFGVEITDVFPDESDARMRMVPGYMQSLWEGGRHIHKDDVERLEVTTFEVTDADGGNKRSILGIVRESMSPADHFERVARAIERKNDSFLGYEKSLGHVNLILADHISERPREDREFRTSEILSPRIREALRVTPFRSVRLIAHVGYTDSVYYELDLLWLWEGFMVYMEAIRQTYGAMAEFDHEDVAVLYAHAMREIGWPVELSWQANQPFAVAGDYGIAAVDGRGIVIHDHQDWPLDTLAIRPRSKVSRDVEERVARRFRAMLPNSTLVSSYARPVRPWPRADDDPDVPSEIDR